MLTTFIMGRNVKVVEMRYLVVNAHSSNNIILGKIFLNAFEAISSTLHLTMKYPLENRRVGVVSGDQEIARKCYHDSLRLKINGKETSSYNAHRANYVDLDPRVYSMKD